MRLATALERSAPLAHLRRLLQESKQRFEVIRPHLPTALAAHVRPGPIDENGWTLLAANPAVAAKLRQLQPRLEQALTAGGWQGNAIRVKVQTG
jgi:Dna[CI] antecedent, DciA